MAAKSERKIKVVADNRRARFNYEIGEVVEAGISLTGSEVKSLRLGKATIAESYADTRDGDLWLLNANIPEYLQAGRFNHPPKRPRRLLLHRRQIDKLAVAVEREGMTIVPLKLFFNERGRAKIEIALARGKKLHDKRETDRKRSWEREKGRLLRERLTMPLPIKLDHCVIHVSDWERSTAFYRDVLGAEIVKREVGYAYRFGDVQLNLHGPGFKPAEVARLPVQPGNSDLCFEWKGPIADAVAHLGRCNVAVEAGPMTRFGAKGAGTSVYFRDPDGSLMEFITYGGSA